VQFAGLPCVKNKSTKPKEKDYFRRDFLLENNFHWIFKQGIFQALSFTIL
jgi:hypothetical protein